MGISAPSSTIKHSSIILGRIFKESLGISVMYEFHTGCCVVKIVVYFVWAKVTLATQSCHHHQNGVNIIIVQCTTAHIYYILPKYLTLRDASLGLEDVNIMPLDSYLGRSKSREQGSLDLPQKIDRNPKKEQNTAVEVLAAVNGWKHLLFRILLHFYSASQSGGPR